MQELLVSASVDDENNGESVAVLQQMCQMQLLCNEEGQEVKEEVW